MLDEIAPSVTIASDSVHALEQRSREIPCGFIHLPYMPDQVSSMLKTGRSEQDQQHSLASMELSRMIRAVEIAIATCSRWWREPNRTG
jgi:pyrrolidone-carboxylate peptidase